MQLRSFGVACCLRHKPYAIAHYQYCKHIEQLEHKRWDFCYIVGLKRIDKMRR